MEMTVQYNHVESEPIWIDFEGAHFPITGNLAFFYRLFKTMKCEEQARQELYPWLMAEKNKRTANTAMKTVRTIR